MELVKRGSHTQRCRELTLPLWEAAAKQKRRRALQRVVAETGVDETFRGFIRDGRERSGVISCWIV
jgi:hypothetical protein